MSKFHECMHVIKSNFLLTAVNSLFSWVLNSAPVSNHKNLKCSNMVPYGSNLSEKIKVRY